MQKRNVLNSPRLLELKKHKQRIFLKKILIFCFGFLVFFILLAFLSRLKSLNVSEIEVVGNKVINMEIIKSTVESQLAGKYFWLFPKTNIFFYPKNNIKNELQDKFKRLKDINLSVKNNKILEVSLSERVASYTWCGVEPLLLGEGAGGGSPQCYFLDADGYIFDEAPYFSGEIYFKFYGGVALGGESSVPVGSYFSKKNFKQLLSLKELLLSIKLKPVALAVSADGDIEVFLSKGTSTGTEPKIILKIDSDFQNVVENLQTALTTEPLQSEFKNKYSKLQYIDLRFGNKVYDKFSQ